MVVSVSAVKRTPAFLLTLAAGLLLALALSPAANAAKVFKIATVSPDGSSWMKVMRKAADDIQTATEDRVKIKFYPGGVMGNDGAVMRKIRIKQLHGAALPGGSMRKYFTDVEAYSLPLLFRDFAEVDYVRERMDQKIMQGIEDGGFACFGIAEGGLAYAMSDTAVSTIEDLRAKKVWIPADDAAALQAVQAFDISPFPLELSNVLVSLQTNMVNAVATSPIAAIALQWHTQVKHISDLPLMYFFGTLVLDKKAFSGVSEADQAEVRRIFSASFKEIDQQNRADNEKAFLALQQQGLILDKIPAEESARWYERASTATDKIVESGIVTQPFYQEMAKHLQEYRAKSTAE